MNHWQGCAPDLLKIFFPAIEKGSKGRLKIESHWGAEISTGYDALSAVGVKGTADMAIVVPEYSLKVLPLHRVFKSFPIGPGGISRLQSSAASTQKFRRSRKKCKTRMQLIEVIDGLNGTQHQTGQ